MAAYEPVLAALADPTRRALLERLSRGPRAVRELAAGLPVSRPAVSQHLRVLLAAGIAGREGRLYRLEPGGLAEARRYLEGLEQGRPAPAVLARSFEWAGSQARAFGALAAAMGAARGGQTEFGRVALYEPFYRLLLAAPEAELELRFVVAGLGRTRVELEARHEAGRGPQAEALVERLLSRAGS